MSVARVLRHLAAALVLVTSLVGSTPTDDTVISRDFLTPGDNKLTLDTATGLEWLDLTETDGLNPVEAVSAFSEHRFRWATAAEVNSLLAAFGLPEKAGGPFTSASVPLADAERFLDFLGVTEPPAPSGLNGPASTGQYDDELDDNLSRFIQVDLTEGTTVPGIPNPTVANNRFRFPCDDCIASGNQGVFLVRPSVLHLQIDIKPGSDVDTINLSSRGVIPVAILGSDTLDVAEVDVTTLSFGPEGAPPTHQTGGHPEDVNNDGFTDLVTHYRTQQTGLTHGHAEVCVTGELLDGTPFEGCDAVRLKG